jgi:hypothetical protein
MGLIFAGLVAAVMAVFGSIGGKPNNTAATSKAPVVQATAAEVSNIATSSLSSNELAAQNQSAEAKPVAAAAVAPADGEGTTLYSSDWSPALQAAVGAAVLSGPGDRCVMSNGQMLPNCVSFGRQAAAEDAGKLNLKRDVVNSLR